MGYVYVLDRSRVFDFHGRGHSVPRLVGGVCIMTKRILSILLVALVLMSIPISVGAQTTEFQVTSSSVAHNAVGFNVILTVNWYHVATILRVDGGFYEEGWFDGPNNTYLSFWLTYEHLGVDAGETGELTIEVSNGTRVYMEDDWLLERPECVLTFAFSVPYPELIFVDESPPHHYDESPDFGLEPLPFDFISNNAWSILAVIFGGFLVIFGIALGPAPEKQKKTKLEVTDAVKSLCDWDGGVGKEYNDRYYAIRMTKIDMSNVYPYPEETMLYPDYETHTPSATGQLPNFSSPDDDENWRICPYCGEWNHGEKTRCDNCAGRLGRPLGR
jgi:hypothetical protein